MSRSVVATPNSGRLRAWWASTRQKDRRLAGVPVLLSGTFETNQSQPSWADAILTYYMPHGVYPVANLEVWLSIDGAAFSQVDTTPSNGTTYRDVMAVQGESLLVYKFRYVNGGVVRPFSNVFEIQIVI
jgi:hypothetical protein